MSDLKTEKRGQRGVIWLLVALVLVALYWWFRPEGGGAQTAAVPDWTGADPDDIVVDLRDDASDATVAAIERDLGIDLELVSAQSLDERFYKAHVPAADRDRLLAALAQRPEVEIAEPDGEMAIPPGEQVVFSDVDAAWEGFPNDPKYKFQWHFGQIGMPEAWKLEDGEGVVVAVLDTGVAYEAFGKYHQVEDLEGIEFVQPYDFVDDDDHANDDHGHGTHVTGTIAQRTHNGKGVAGIALKAKIMPLKVLGGDGRGSVSGIADAIRYAADEGADVINMSLGGPFSSRVMKKACEYATKKGVTIVAAAGNESRSKVGYPAAYPGVIAVAATQFDEATTFYSNYGKDVDIAAPGGNTRIDQNGDGMPDGVLQNTIAIGNPTRSDYFGFMGTSMASPHVAGVAALVIGAGVTDPAEVEKVLTETARKPNGQTYVRDRFGAGIVDAPAAIKKARGAAGDHGVDLASVGRPLGLGVIALVLGLLVAGAVASSTRGQRGVALNLGYLVGVVLAVAAYVGLQTSGMGQHELIQSALVPLVLLAVFYGSPRLRGPLAGMAAGVAGFLMVTTVMSPDLWGVVNTLACIGLARVAIKR